MKRKRTNPIRYVFLCTLVVGVALVYIARLINLQFVSADNYNYVSDYTYTRTEKIQAQRGEIYDRNGVALVTNEYYYNALLDYGDIPSDAAGFNGAILNVVWAAEKCGEQDKLTDPAYALSKTDGKLTFAEDYAADGKYRNKLIRLLTQLEYGGNGLTDEERKAACEAITPEELEAFLLKRYKLLSEEGEPLYTEKETQILLERRFALDMISFSVVIPLPPDSAQRVIKFILTSSANR